MHGKSKTQSTILAGFCRQTNTNTVDLTQANSTPAPPPPAQRKQAPAQCSNAPAPTLQLACSCKVKADQYKTDTKHSTRVLVKLWLKKEEGKKSSELAAQELRKILGGLRSIDPKIGLLPYKEADLANLNAITSVKDIPNALSLLRPYCSKLKLKLNSHNFFGLHLAHDVPPIHIYSKEGSDSRDVGEDDNHGCFEVACKDSDDPVSIGTFMYSGKFLNSENLQQDIQAYCKTKPTTSHLILGCKHKKDKTLASAADDTGTRNSDWMMADDHPIWLEVHRPHAAAAMRIMHDQFNNIADPRLRLGGHNIKFLPAKRPNARRYMRYSSSHQCPEETPSSALLPLLWLLL